MRKWEMVELGEILTITSGGTPNRKQNEYFDDATIPWVKTGDLKTRYLYDASEYISELGLKSSSAKIFPPNTVLLALYGATIGACSTLKIHAATNQACAALLPNEKLNESYLYYFLLSSKEQLIARGVGGAQPNISGKIIKETKIPLPPLPIQQQIAEVLDTADALRRCTQEQLDALDELAQGVFLEMFGDVVSNDKGWRVAKVIEFSDCIVPGRDKPKSFTGDIPWVTTDDLINKGFTSLSKKAIGLTIDEISTVRARVIPSNSVIITCVGDLGIISINTKEMVVNQQLHTFQCHQELNPVYLMYNLSFQTPYMYKMASSTTVPYMNKTVCNNIPIVVPPLPLQTQFAAIITNIEEQKAVLRESLRESEGLFGGLLQRVFG